MVPSAYLRVFQALDRFEHEVASVECHHHLMVAFGPELLAQKLAVPGRMLPIDESGFESRHEFAQSLEFRPLAFLRLCFHPVDRLA